MLGVGACCAARAQKPHVQGAHSRALGAPQGPENEQRVRLSDSRTAPFLCCLSYLHKDTTVFLSLGKHETAQMFARGESCEVQMFARGEQIHFSKRKCQIISLHADTLSITQSKRASKLHTWAWGSPLATRSHGRFSRTCTIQSSRAGTTMTLKAVCAAEPCQMCDHTTMRARCCYCVVLTYRSA